MGDAVYKAIDSIVGVNVKLESYKIESVTDGIEALAIARVVIYPESKEWTGKSTHAQSGMTTERKFSGAGSDNDIVVSSARAYTVAMNKLLSWNLSRKNQQDATDDKRDGSTIGDATSIASTIVVA